MTLRRLFVLVSQLPPDSRTKAKLSGDRAGARWSDDTRLSADMHELLQMIRIEQLATAPWKDRPRLPEFHRLPRPELNLADDVDQGDDGDGVAETTADRYERIQRFLSQFDPPQQQM